MLGIRLLLTLMFSLLFFLCIWFLTALSSARLFVGLFILLIIISILFVCRILVNLLHPGVGFVSPVEERERITLSSSLSHRDHRLFNYFFDYYFSSLFFPTPHSPPFKLSFLVSAVVFLYLFLLSLFPLCHSPYHFCGSSSSACGPRPHRKEGSRRQGYALLCFILSYHTKKAALPTSYLSIPDWLGHIQVLQELGGSNMPPRAMRVELRPRLTAEAVYTPGQPLERTGDTSTHNPVLANATPGIPLDNLASPLLLKVVHRQLFQQRVLRQGGASSYTSSPHFQNQNRRHPTRDRQNGNGQAAHPNWSNSSPGNPLQRDQRPRDRHQEPLSAHAGEAAQVHDRQHYLDRLQDDLPHARGVDEYGNVLNSPQMSVEDLSQPSRHRPRVGGSPNANSSWNESLSVQTSSVLYGSPKAYEKPFLSSVSQSFQMNNMIYASPKYQGPARTASSRGGELSSSMQDDSGEYPMRCVAAVGSRGQSPTLGATAGGGCTKSGNYHFIQILDVMGSSPRCSTQSVVRSGNQSLNAAHGVENVTDVPPNPQGFSPVPRLSNRFQRGGAGGGGGSPRKQVATTMTSTASVQNSNSNSHLHKNTSSAASPQARNFYAFSPTNYRHARADTQVPDSRAREEYPYSFHEEFDDSTFYEEEEEIRHEKKQNVSQIFALSLFMLYLYVVEVELKWLHVQPMKYTETETETHSDSAPLERHTLPLQTNMVSRWTPTHIYIYIC
eukprot:gene1621-991_t